MSRYLATCLFLVLAGCGGGGGGGGGGPTPPPPGPTYTLDARVYGWISTGGTVTFAGSTTSGADSTGQVAQGSTVTLTAHPAAGYTVQAWYQSNDDTELGTTNTVTVTAEGQIVKVQFMLIPHAPG